MAIRAIRRTDTAFEVIACEDLTTADVKRIAAALARRPRGAVTTIDLRHVRTCQPPALLMLSRLLAAAGAPYELRGLTGADHRLLQYLEPTARASRACVGAISGEEADRRDPSSSPPLRRPVGRGGPPSSSSEEETR
jgi:hypothetical protein